MAIIEPSHIGHTPFQQLLGHHEDIMKTWSALSDYKRKLKEYAVC